MKRLLICSAVALAVFAAGYSAMGKPEDKGPGPKKMAKAHRYMHDANAPMMRDANAPMLRDPNAPRRQAPKADQWAQAIQARIGRLEAIKQIAIKEGATKTVEALDKLIADEKKPMEIRQQRIAEMRAKHKADMAERQKEVRQGPPTDPNA